MLATDTLAELVHAKRSCLTQLRDLGRRQFELIEAGDMPRLLDVLSAKQDVLSRVQRIERALDPFRDEDPEARVWRTADGRARCADDIHQCETLLAEVLAQEKRSEAALVVRRDEAQARLQSAHVGLQARGAYTAEPLAAGALGQLDLCIEG